MLETWILMIFLGHQAGGLSVEFNSIETCQEAGKKYIAMVQTSLFNPRFICTKK